MKTPFLTVPLAGALLGLAPIAQAQTAAAPYRLLRTIPVGGEGSWDFVVVEVAPAGERLYVAHGTQPNVIDFKTKQLARAVLHTPAAHGIAIVPGTFRVLEFGR